MLRIESSARGGGDVVHRSKLEGGVPHMQPRKLLRHRGSCVQCITLPEVSELSRADHERAYNRHLRHRAQAGQQVRHRTNKQ